MKRALLISGALFLPLLLAQANNPIQLVTVLGANLSITSSTSNQVVVTGNVTEIILQP